MQKKIEEDERNGEEVVGVLGEGKLKYKKSKRSRRVQEKKSSTIYLSVYLEWKRSTGGTRSTRKRSENEEKKKEEKD